MNYIKFKRKIKILPQIKTNQNLAKMENSWIFLLTQKKLKFFLDSTIALLFIIDNSFKINGRAHRILIKHMSLHRINKLSEIAPVSNNYDEILKFHHSTDKDHIFLPESYNILLKILCQNGIQKNISGKDTTTMEFYKFWEQIPEKIITEISLIIFNNFFQNTKQIYEELINRVNI